MVQVSYSEFKRIKWLKKLKKESRQVHAKANTKISSLGSRKPQKTLKSMPWAYWRNKCDTIWAEAVKTTARNLGQTMCRRCGQHFIDSACHIIPRGKYATRWLLRNGYAGCHFCNNGERLNRLLYRDHHIKMVGQSEYEALYYIGNHGKSKFSKDELRDIYEDLKRVAGEVAL